MHIRWSYAERIHLFVLEFDPLLVETGDDYELWPTPRDWYLARAAIRTATSWTLPEYEAMNQPYLAAIDDVPIATDIPATIEAAIEEGGTVLGPLKCSQRNILLSFVCSFQSLLVPPTPGGKSYKIIMDFDVFSFYQNVDDFSCFYPIRKRLWRFISSKIKLYILKKNKKVKIITCVRNLEKVLISRYMQDLHLRLVSYHKKVIVYKDLKVLTDEVIENIENDIDLDYFLMTYKLSLNQLCPFGLRSLALQSINDTIFLFY